MPIDPDNKFSRHTDPEFLDAVVAPLVRYQRYGADAVLIDIDLYQELILRYQTGVVELRELRAEVPN